MGYARDLQDEARTVGGRWGCALSAIVGIPLLLIVVALSAMGDCYPSEPCEKPLPWGPISGVLAMAALVGFASRVIINAIAQRLRRGD